MTVDARIARPGSNPEDVEPSGASPLVEHRLEDLLTPLNPSAVGVSPRVRIPGFYKPSELLLLKQPGYLIQQLLPAEGVTCLTGPSGSGKTFLAVAMACSVATGIDFLGYKAKRGGVVYLAAEGIIGIGRRIFAWEKTNKAKAADRLDVVKPPMLLNEPASFNYLAERLDQHRASYSAISLIVVDTLAQTMSGVENDAEPMLAYVRALEALAGRYDCAALVLHHPPKDTTEKSGAGLFRGHGSLYAALQCGLAIMTTGAGCIELTQPKNKDDEPAPKTTLRLTPVDLASELGTNDSGDPITSCVVEVATGALSVAVPPKHGPAKSDHRRAADEAILRRLQDGRARHRDLKQAVAAVVVDSTKAQNTLKTALEGLQRERKIRQRDDGLWELTAADSSEPLQPSGNVPQTFPP